MSCQVFVHWQSQMLLHICTVYSVACVYRHFLCRHTSSESGLIIKWQKRAHAAKVFCNLRGLTQQGFNTATPPQCLSPPPPRFHFKGFRLKSYLLKEEKNDYTAYLPHQTPPIFISLSLSPSLRPSRFFFFFVR